MGRPAVIGRPLSLKARALQWLSQREHSRVELRRRLLNVLRQRARLAAGKPEASASEVGPNVAPDTESGVTLDAASGHGSHVMAGEGADPVDALLDELESAGLLSAERFVESRVHARSARFGTARIRRELEQHALTLSAEAEAALRASEAQRLQAVHQRRYGDTPPADPADRARRARFLIARGFAPDLVQRLWRGG